MEYHHRCDDPQNYGNSNANLLMAFHDTPKKEHVNAVIWEYQFGGFSIHLQIDLHYFVCLTLSLYLSRSVSLWIQVKFYIEYCTCHQPWMVFTEQIDSVRQNERIYCHVRFNGTHLLTDSNWLSSFHAYVRVENTNHFNRVPLVEERERWGFVEERNEKNELTNDECTSWLNNGNWTNNEMMYDKFPMQICARTYRDNIERCGGVNYFYHYLHDNVESVWACWLVSRVILNSSLIMTAEYHSFLLSLVEVFAKTDFANVHKHIVRKSFPTDMSQATSTTSNTAVQKYCEFRISCQSTMCLATGDFSVSEIIQQNIVMHTFREFHNIFAVISKRSFSARTFITPHIVSSRGNHITSRNYAHCHWHQYMDGAAFYLFTACCPLKVTL